MQDATASVICHIFVSFPVAPVATDFPFPLSLVLYDADISEQSCICNVSMASSSLLFPSTPTKKFQMEAPWCQ